MTFNMSPTGTRNRSAKPRGRFDPAHYEKVTFRNEGGVGISSFEISTVISLLTPTDLGRLLEVGMGTGRVLRNITTRAQVVVGLDPDPKMVRSFATTMKLAGRGMNSIDLVVAEGENLPFRPYTFTGVISIRALRYFRNATQGIKEMCSVLKPRGRLVLEFSNVYQLRSLLQIHNFVLAKEPYPRLFKLAEVRRQVRTYGISVDSVVGWHKFPPMILTLIRNHILVRVILQIEAILQRVTPVDLFSRSIVLSGTKQR